MKLAGLAVAALLAAAPSGSRAREAAIASLFDSVARADEPGLAVLVRQDGKTVFARGYGIRDLRSRERIDPATSFRLASVTKQFTAMAVMLLVRDGKLRYEDHLTDLFPAFPAYGKGITIRHLLTHTSGLPDYEDLMQAAEKDRPPIWTAERQIQDNEVLALLRGETKGRFDPGTSWAYSNSGYVVLGLVVARASGKPFGDFPDPGRPASYGFGWFLDARHGRPRMWHHGSTIGFRTVIERFPDDRLTVVVLANRDDLDVRALALDAADLHLQGFQ